MMMFTFIKLAKISSVELFMCLNKFLKGYNVLQFLIW